MLDLEAGVDLEEGDVALRTDEELAGAGTDVPGAAQDLLGGPQELGVLLVGDERGRGLLDELLVAPLEGAVAGGDDDDVAVLVRQALRLDVAGVVQEALDEALAATEGRDGLAHRRLEQLGDLLEVTGDLQPSATAAVGGLDGDGQPVLFRELDDLVGALDRVRRAGNQRGVGSEGDVARLDLVAEAVDGLGAGPDPHQTGVDDLLREAGVLGEEAVAGVNGIRTRLVGDLDELVLQQVGVAGRRAPEGVGLVRDLDVEGVPVGVGVDGHGCDPVVGAGAGDADGDLTAVGDEDFADGHASDSSVTSGAIDRWWGGARAAV